MTRDAKCIRSGRCRQVCLEKAITLDQKGRRIHRSRCNLCLKCAEACPSGAIGVVGKYATWEEVLAEVEADRLFYENSGGGVTVSGGEPLSQPEFVHHLLSACQQRGLHTALDTCGYALWEVLEQTLEFVDLVLYDLKHMNPQSHRQGTGKSNSLILQNVQKIASRKMVWLRAPLVPGYNDSAHNLQAVGELAIRLKVEKVSLLPYHALGKPKHEQLGRKCLYPSVAPPSDEHLQEAKRSIEALGVKVTIGN